MNIADLEPCRPHFVAHKILTLAFICVFGISKLGRKNKHLYRQAEDLRTLSLKNIGTI